MSWLKRRKASDDQGRMKLAKKMTEIIWKEQALADKEEIERKKAKSKERWRRWRQRREQQKTTENDAREAIQAETASEEYGQSEQTSPSDQHPANGQCSAYLGEESQRRSTDGGRGYWISLPRRDPPIPHQ